MNDKTGDKVDWHKGIPGTGRSQEKDHWHWVPGGRKEKEHYLPGERIRRVTVGAAVLAATALAIEVIAEYWPIAILAVP